MIVFILRRFLLLLLTMILVSMAVFYIAESSPGNIAKNVLGAFITPEQEASFIKQNGLDKSHGHPLPLLDGGQRLDCRRQNRHAAQTY